MCRSHRLLGSDTGSANALPWLGSVGICLVMAFWLHDLVYLGGKKMSAAGFKLLTSWKTYFDCFFLMKSQVFCIFMLMSAIFRYKKYCSLSLILCLFGLYLASMKKNTFQRRVFFTWKTVCEQASLWRIYVLQWGSIQLQPLPLGLNSYLIFIKSLFQIVPICCLVNMAIWNIADRLLKIVYQVVLRAVIVLS